MALASAAMTPVRRAPALRGRGAQNLAQRRGSLDQCDVTARVRDLDRVEHEAEGPVSASLLWRSGCTLRREPPGQFLSQVGAKTERLI